MASQRCSTGNHSNKGFSGLDTLRYILEGISHNIFIFIICLHVQNFSSFQTIAQSVFYTSKIITVVLKKIRSKLEQTDIVHITFKKNLLKLNKQMLLRSTVVKKVAFQVGLIKLAIFVHFSPLCFWQLNFILYYCRPQSKKSCNM